jgi:hypothetical protein
VVEIVKQEYLKYYGIKYEKLKSKSKLDVNSKLGKKIFSENTGKNTCRNSSGPQKKISKPRTLIRKMLRTRFQ